MQHGAMCEPKIAMIWPRIWRKAHFLQIFLPTLVRGQGGGSPSGYVTAVHQKHSRQCALRNAIKHWEYEEPTFYSNLLYIATQLAHRSFECIS